MTIVGGAAVDIISKSGSVVQGSGNSHIGQIAMHGGGSARNAAECLSRLGLAQDLNFISCIGDDL